MKFKRTFVALAVGAVVSTVGYASASVLTVDGGTIQYGGDGVSCDTDGVKANWGLETNDNTVRSVRISGIDSACEGAEMFVKVGGVAGDARSVVLTGAESQSMSFTAPYPTPESINNVQIWIEG